MKERIALFVILLGLTAFIYMFQYHVNTLWGYVLLLSFMTVYGIYSTVALQHNKRKLKKQPLKINEDYKPFVSIMIPAHDEETVITNTVDNIMQLNYQNFEIIIIDDRSTDNTANVIKDLELKYKGKVKTLIREKDAFPGKSAVLNDALKLAKGDVGAVQARKVIRNGPYNLLTRCQYNEYVLDTYLQVGRDAIKGAVELRGNGELIKRKALEDIDGWNNYTITDDLDMSTRLHIKGWDVRYCPSAEVYEEGIIYLVPLFRQRRRWLEGTIRRYLEYSSEAIKSAKMSLRAKLDMIAYITQFIMPLWMILEIVIRAFKALTGKGVLQQELFSSVVIAIITAIGFFMAIRYSLRQYDNQKRIPAFIQASYTAVYMLIIWFPMVLFICGKILFCKKNMNWGKTAHGLVMEEEAGHKNINNTEKELQEVQ